MNRTTKIGLAIIIGATVNVHAQNLPAFKVSGYLETYYTHDFNKPSDHNRPSLIYSHNRSQEVNINLAYLKGAYDSGNVRANLALAVGSYMNANYSVEPNVLKNIFEANAGVKLSKNQNLWLDAGIFSSHIGFESAVSKDCWALTRNISSENTPYFESGAKISYATADNRFAATLLYLNGWQRIQRVDGNNKPAGGLQLTYKPNDKITLNYSNYLGHEGADSIAVQRLYHNFYGIFQLSNKLGLTAGFDYGTQQTSKTDHRKKEVISPVAMVRYAFTQQWAMTGRFEYYKDRNGVMVSALNPNGFEAKGYSLNIDYSPYKQALLRIEGKVYNGKNQFVRDGVPVDYNVAITASLALSF